MRLSSRKLFPYCALLLCAGALGWVFSRKAPAPADFTFANGDDIKSVDPAVVTGAPEGRVIGNIYEGLLNWDPKDLHPIPGVAESWEISEDGKTYTFHLRKDALWADLAGNTSPVTAHDFVYSYRRFLDPQIASQYAFILFHVEGAEAFQRGTRKKGDPVDVELPDPPQEAIDDGRPHARGEMLRAKFISVEEVKIEGRKRPARVYTVEVDGRRQRYSSQADKLGDDSIEKCRQVLNDVESIAICALDDHTLQIKLITPVPYFINLMGFYPLSPVNQRCVETHGFPAWTKVENLVTNGPFLMESRRLRDRIRLIKNPHYWDRDEVYLNTVDVLAVSSDTTALNLYMTGKVDWILTVPATVVPELLKQKRDDFKPAPYLAAYFYRVNTTRPPLDDPRVRKALSLVINRQEITENITRAGEIPATHLVPPGMADYDLARQRHRSSLGESAAKSREQDIELAQKLLAEAGYPGGKGFRKIELLYNSNETHEQIAQLIQAQWDEALGIKIELVGKEWGSYLSDQHNMEYWISRTGWIGDYSDPNTFLDLFVGDGTQNQTGWKNAEYDKLIKSAPFVRLDEGERVNVEQEVRALPNWSTTEHDRLLSEAVDLATRMKRAEVLRQAEEILVREQPIIPIYHYVSKAMVRPYVKGFYRNVRDDHPLKGIRIDREAKARFLKGEGAR